MGDSLEKTDNFYKIICENAKNLPAVSKTSANNFKKKQTEILEVLSLKLQHTDNIDALLGNQEFDLAKKFSKDLTDLLYNMLNLDYQEMICKSIPYLMNSYQKKGVTGDFFRIFFQYLISSVSEKLALPASIEINKIIYWIKENLDDLLLVSSEDAVVETPAAGKLSEVRDEFLKALLEGDEEKCISISENFSGSSDEISDLFVYVIQPSMYEIGSMWERGDISGSIEHLATVIVSKIMGIIGSKSKKEHNSSKKLLIASAPGEFHQIGGWMLSDMLEYEGWEVKNLGANTPGDFLIDFMKEFRPVTLALSATIIDNVEAVKDIIFRIKSDDELKNTRIVVGGKVFNDNNGLWEKVGADAYAKDLKEAKKIIMSR